MYMAEAVAQPVLKFTPDAEEWVFESQLQQTSVVKQVVSGGLRNAQQSAPVSRLFKITIINCSPRRWRSSLKRKPRVSPANGRLGV